MGLKIPLKFFDNKMIKFLNIDYFYYHNDLYKNTKRNFCEVEKC